MTFLVTMREVHKQVIEIEADDEAQAVERVLDGEGDSEKHQSEYDYTLDSDEWTVEPAPEADNRSPERRAQDERIAAEPPLSPVELPPGAPGKSVEEMKPDG